MSVQFPIYVLHFREKAISIESIPIHIHVVCRLLTPDILMSCVDLYTILVTGIEPRALHMIVQMLYQLGYTLPTLSLSLTWKGICV